MSKGSVFLIGPGFIGGEILSNLLNDGYNNITVLVRRESVAASFHQLGITTALGTLEDLTVIQKQTALHDIVIHSATADHLPSVQAVLTGISDRAANGLSTIYIHTSGASLLSDTAAGDYESDVIYDDENPAMIDALPETADHRLIDLAIVNARTELGNKAKLAIMIPPLIYGVSNRDRRLSIQLPAIVRYSLKHGYAGQIGKGVSVWNQIHVADLARGYMALLHWIEQTSATDVNTNPYWFCENGEELSWGECSAEIGRALYQASRIKDPEPKTIPPENYGDLFGGGSGSVLGSNSRSRANRLRGLGWQPREKKTLQSLVEDEVPILLKETGEWQGYMHEIASRGSK
jgi:nucleoside-diphosphate-sugar epimerase